MAQPAPTSFALHELEGICDYCGEKCDSTQDELNAITCTFEGCPNPGIYHQHCVETYLKCIRLDKQRKAGFQCPRGNGKATKSGKPCPGRVSKSHPIHARNDNSKKRRKAKMPEAIIAGGLVNAGKPPSAPIKNKEPKDKEKEKEKEKKAKVSSLAGGISIVVAAKPVAPRPPPVPIPSSKPLAGGKSGFTPGTSSSTSAKVVNGHHENGRARPAVGEEDVWRRGTVLADVGVKTASSSKSLQPSASATVPNAWGTSHRALTHPEEQAPLPMPAPTPVRADFASRLKAAAPTAAETRSLASVGVAVGRSSHPDPGVQVVSTPPASGKAKGRKKGAPAVAEQQGPPPHAAPAVPIPVAVPVPLPVPVPVPAPVPVPVPAPAPVPSPRPAEEARGWSAACVGALRERRMRVYTSQLQELGFSRGRAVEALHRHLGNLDACVDWLLFSSEQTGDGLGQLSDAGTPMLDVSGDFAVLEAFMLLYPGLAHAALDALVVDMGGNLVALDGALRAGLAGPPHMAVSAGLADEPDSGVAPPAGMAAVLALLEEPEGGLRYRDVEGAPLPGPAAELGPLDCQVWGPAGGGPPWHQGREGVQAWFCGAPEPEPVVTGPGLTEQEEQEHLVSQLLEQLLL